MTTMTVDMTGIMRQTLAKAMATARKREEAGDNELAAWYYRFVADRLTHLAESTPYATLRQRYHERAIELRAVAERVQNMPQEETPQTDGGGNGLDEDYSERIRQLITQSPVNWSDVAGMDETQRAIKETYVLALASMRDGTTDRPASNLLLYGPAGTGKTLLAAAVSNGLDATFFCVSAGDLLSKWFGDSSRLVAALYAEARRRQPSVIFIDDFEALVPDRSSDISGAEARVLSQILVEMDGLRSKHQNAFVMTIAATNAPWRIDHAALSRFGRTVYVPLPNAATRAAIFNLHLLKKEHRCEASPEWLAEWTRGYSGREIAQICAEMVRRMTARANPGLAQVADQGRDSAANYRIRKDLITKDDFRGALAGVRRACSEDAERRYRNWSTMAY